MREPAGIGTSVGDAVAIYLLFSVQANLFGNTARSATLTRGRQQKTESQK